MKKIFSMIALMLMAVAAHAEGTLTITISDAVMEEESMTFYCMGTDQSIAEGTYVQFDMMTWHTATGHIYINNEAVYTWSGSSYTMNVYHFTAGKNCVIKGMPYFDPDNNPNIYITMDVDVTSVSLSQTEATLNIGETLTLTPTVLPNIASDKTVTWTTSDATVATVADGVVTAVAAGTATITVTTTDGAKTATCTVTVAEPTYNVTVKEGTEDADKWTITPTSAKAGETVTIKYKGTKKVKSVKAVKK